jgi:Tol biopolymer transport system component
MKTNRETLRRREFLKKTSQALAATAACAAVGSAVAPVLARGGDAERARRSRISYYCNGEIYVTEVGKPEGKPLTTGHWDFKPSWSKTGDMLVCFRRLKNDPDTLKWKTAIFVINVDGTGFHTLSDGTHTDFNPTWTRNGKNTPLWNRKNDATGGFHVMQSNVGGKPGEEVAITDESFHTWAHSCLMDGRILVNSLHPALGWGVFLLTTKPGAKAAYERIDCERSLAGQLHRASISPTEKKICFEYLAGATFTEPGHTLYIADFDAERRKITNPKVIANAERKPFWYAYPRWINGESAVVYHLNNRSKGQLYVYELEDSSTRRVSTNPNADYRYPHGEAAPC